MSKDMPEHRPFAGSVASRGAYYFRFEPAERTLLHVLRSQSRARPDRPWLIFDAGEPLTFAGAWDAIEKVAAAVARDVRRGGRVGLLMRNQREFPLASFGAMRAGCASVPLHADARGQTLQHMVTRSGIEVLIGRSDLLPALDELADLAQLRLIVCVDEPPEAPLSRLPVVRWEAWLDDAHPQDLPMPRPQATAMIQFTSGSTGVSKGAMLTHHCLYLNSAAICDMLNRSEDDVLTSSLPLYHIGANNNVVNVSIHAGCVGHLKSRFSVSRFWDEAAADGATFALLVGPMAGMILKKVSSAPPHHVESILCSALSGQDRAEFERRFGVRIIWQAYASTEAHGMPFRPEPVPGSPPDTLGHGHDWMEYAVVDPDDNLLGPGEIGELVLRPLIPFAIASGYISDPDATERAFRNLLFHTGDLASYDESGLIRFRGRSRDRIRRRGENIAAVEIERVAVQHPDVLEVAAFAVPGEFGDDEVKLDMVARTTLDLAAFRDWLAPQMPRFMVPRYLEQREELPKTPSHRIEKYKLAADGVARESVVDAGDAQATPLKQE